MSTKYRVFGYSRWPLSPSVRLAQGGRFGRRIGTKGETMQLVQAWKHVVLGNYANFSGRARRSELWWYVLANMIIFAVLNVLANVSDLFSLAASLYWVAVLVPGIAVGVRRLHDIGKKGLWLLIAFIPIVGGLILLYWAVQDSHKGSNEWGVSPKYPIG